MTRQHDRLGQLGARTRALLDRVDVPAEPPDRSYVPERTLAAADFLPAWFLRVGLERARAVARLELVDGAKTYFGTGFMVSPSLLMTNHHVLPSVEVARRARVFFDFEDDEQGRQLSPQLFLAQPDRFFLANELLDVALVAVADDPGRRWGTIPLRHAPCGLAPGERVNLIQHPRGGTKQIVMHGNEVVAVAEGVIHYLADTEGGSSGSPVFNSRWDLVALHYRGGERDNLGVRIDKILKYLTVMGAERGAGPLLRELLDGVLDSGDFGLFATAGLQLPTQAVGDVEKTVWMGGAEFLDPGYWDVAPLFAGVDSVAGARPRIDALVAAVELAGADVFVLESVPAELRPLLAEALRARDLTVELLGERALLCLDPAVSSTVATLEGEAAELARETCKGQPVLPPCFVKLRLTLAREGAAETREFELLFVELDAARDLPSRAHRNELARVLGSIALSCGRDVVIMGVLAHVLDQPGLRELVAPPELTILAAPPRPGNADVGTIAWVGDGRGADLEHVYCLPEVRTIHLDAKVERHEFERKLELPAELGELGPPLLIRARFGELLRAPSPHTQASPHAPAPAPGGEPREIQIDAHVKSIWVVDT